MTEQTQDNTQSCSVTTEVLMMEASQIPQERQLFLYENKHGRQQQPKLFVCSAVCAEEASSGESLYFSGPAFYPHSYSTFVTSSVANIKNLFILFLIS